VSSKIVLQTAADQVYEELRGRIVRHELSPGTPLPLAELADDLGVSTMPVRAALPRLEAEGLVRQVRHRGATVAPLDMEDLEVIQAVRIGIEGFAAELGARSMSDEDVEQLKKALERCRVLADRGDLDAYLSALWEMHDICYAAADRRRLLDLIHQYRRRAERYIRLAVSNQELRNNIALQERLVQAFIARDGEAARRAIFHALTWMIGVLESPIQGDDVYAPTARSRIKGPSV
jgi:DNA-binding GntR family transcriptional regulator